LQIGRLCVELNTNWRALEGAFRRLLGITPKRYVQLVRLARTRRLLLQPRNSRTVAEVAIACGISHLGRFSRAYFTAFGEMPSETLRRA
jgi:transcriptional regulator GlxA family with amidase domain